MRGLIATLLLTLSAGSGFAAGIDPSAVDLAWVNGPSRDSRYKLRDFPNRVHVWEAYSVSCSWCAHNAPQVKALKAQYAHDPRVEVIDLGLDTRDTDYARWIQTHQPTYPVVKDEGRAIWSALSSETGIPQTFVTACDGTLVGSTIGYWDQAAKDVLQEAIRRAKETVCAP